MASPAICIRSTSIVNGQLMVKDMWPNRSQANPVTDPSPQGPRYLRVVENGLPVVSNDAVYRSVSGLSAYLLANLEDGAGASITVQNAVDMADLIIASMRAGAPLTLAEINDVAGPIKAVVALAGVGVGDSTATVNGILQILAGAHYAVPAGHILEVAGAFQQPADFFDYTIMAPVVEEDSSFWISVAQGDLLGMKTADFVVLYDGLGNIL
jgi:hypothetical protein